MAGAHWTQPPERGNQRTPDRANRRPRSVETSAPPTVRTGGGLGGPHPRPCEPAAAWGSRTPDRANRRRPGRAAPPTGRTGGGLLATPRWLRGGSLDFAEPLRPVLVENPPPIFAGPQPLAVRVAPDHAGGSLDGIRPHPGRGNPVAQFREVFDDHGGIIPGRGNRRNPDRGNPSRPPRLRRAGRPDRGNPEPMPPLRGSMAPGRGNPPIPTVRHKI